EKNARGLQRSRSYNHHPGISRSMLMRDAINVVDALGTPAAVHQQVADDGIADQRIFSGSGRCGKGDRRTIEVRSGKTATLTLVAVMTGGTASMVHCEVRHAAGHPSPAKLALAGLFRHSTTPSCSHPSSGLTSR